MPITAMAGLLLIRKDISLTRPGRLLVIICGSMMRRKNTPLVMPQASAASFCSREKLMNAVRQTSALKAAVFRVRARIAAVLRSMARPKVGAERKMNSTRVTSGVARARLT